MLQSFRPLVRFWAAVLLLSGAGAAALQAIGPPPSASGGPVAAPGAPAPEAAPSPSPAAPGAISAAAVEPDAAEVAPVAVPVPADAPAAASAGPSPAPPGPRKVAPSQRAASASEGGGPRYGGAGRRAPTRDIWGNPLQPPDPVWGDRPLPGGPLPGGRGEAGYIGVYTPTPEGTRGPGGADRRAPTRDIWGRPLSPPNAAWGDRPPSRGRGDGEFMGIYTPTPDGSRVLIRPGQ